MKQALRHGAYFMAYLLMALALDAAIFGPAIN